MNFKTIEEAENYYIEKYALTDNSKGEEDARMDRWIEDQDIDEVKPMTISEQFDKVKEEVLKLERLLNEDYEEKKEVMAQMEHKKQEEEEPDDWSGATEGER